MAGNQTFAAEAPVSLIMVSDGVKFRHGNAETMGMIDAGYVSEIGRAYIAGRNGKDKWM